VLVLVFSWQAAAVTHYVSPGESIQAAIDDANDGDEIEVAPGTYNEAINFNGKAVRLYSIGGPNFTTIDANGIEDAYHVVQCVNGEQTDTILEGFTITGGNANGAEIDRFGGGMHCDSSSPTVTNCVFSGNTADCSSGGMHNYNFSNPKVTNCTFINNTANESGGGMVNVISSSPIVNNCLFSGNTANYSGGGILNVDGGSQMVTNCTFINNTANYFGGGMSNHGCSPTVTNCIFINNTANRDGGGMYNFGCGPTVTNCVFINNTANRDGGGIHNMFGGRLTMTNCILWDNEPNEIHNDGDFRTTVTYSDVLGGWGDPNDPNNTNINIDPCFVDAAAGNLRLKPDSPCIDAADSTILLTVPAPADLDGNFRCIDVIEITDTGAGPLKFLDIGAYELQPCRIAGDNNCDGVVNFKDFAILCNKWFVGIEP